MLANTRIQWFHKKVIEMTYPNANRLAERYSISHRQAQRDVDFLRRNLHAPLEYDVNKKGFYYTKPYTLPLLLATSGDSSLVDEGGQLLDADSFDEDNSVIQMQIPYTAVIRVEDKLTALELASFIVHKDSQYRYNCEFHSVERFLSALIVNAPDARILSPDWLRVRLCEMTERILEANREEDADE